MFRTVVCAVGAIMWLAATAAAQTADSNDAARLVDLAQRLYAEKRYGEARDAAARALAIREQTLGPAHIGVIAPLDLLAMAYHAQGESDAAAPLLARSLVLEEAARGPDHPALVPKLIRLGLIETRLGIADDAELLLRRALAIQERSKGREHAELAPTLQALAGSLSAQGKYAETEKLLLRAIAIREEALGLEHPDIAVVLNALALVYGHQGRNAEAESLLRRAIGIVERSTGPDDPGFAALLGNLGSQHRIAGRLADAEAAHRQALAIIEKQSAPNKREWVAALANLAVLLVDLRRSAEAERLTRRALALAEHEIGLEDPWVATLLNNLGTMDHREGRHAEAEPAFERALAIRQIVLGPAHPQTALTLNLLVSVRAAQGRLADGFALAQRALAVLAQRAIDGDANSAGRDSERAANRLAFEHILAAAAAYGITAPDQRRPAHELAFLAAQLATRSSADRALAQASLRLASAEDSLAQAVRRRQDAARRRDALETKIVAAVAREPARRDAVVEQRTRDEIEGLGREIDGIDAELRRDFPTFTTLSGHAPFALGAAQELLQPDEALVMFIVGEPFTFRFTLRRDRVDLFAIPIRRPLLEQLVASLRRSLDPTGIADPSELRPYDATTAFELYRHLFGTARPFLAGTKRLLVVSDGPLGGLPLSVLLTRLPPTSIPETSALRRLDWLVRDYAISVLPSVGSLRALRAAGARAGAAPEPFAGFGDPELGGHGGGATSPILSRLAARGPLADVGLIRELAELPDTAAELQRIAQTLGVDPTNLVHLRRRATERRVKSIDLSRYRVLAFATHGLMAGEFAGYGEPALVLTPPAVPDDADDGLLAASEVAQLKLNADWVILSACNTAAPDGTPGAEGLSGLARAFFYAGSRALLVSHWPVLSEASVRLTTGAIEALANEPKIGRAEALRLAMLSLLEDDALPAAFAHPAIWAPFSLIGEGGAGR